MTRSDQWLVAARIAGYHGDSKTFTRLLVEARVNREALSQAWRNGAIAQARGVECHCLDCKPLAARGNPASEPGDTEHCLLSRVTYFRANARHNAETRRLFGPQIAAHKALADALRAFVGEGK